MPPKLPWVPGKAHEMWVNSNIEGHTQLCFKCVKCSLEFILLTFRAPFDILEAFGFSTGKRVDHAKNVTCPECATKGSSWLVGIRKEDGAIFEFVSKFDSEFEEIDP